MAEKRFVLVAVEFAGSTTSRVFLVILLVLGLCSQTDQPSDLGHEKSWDLVAAQGWFWMVNVEQGNLFRRVTHGHPCGELGARLILMYIHMLPVHFKRTLECCLLK
jgi:hypothetical protein